jgi:hypothetical protein
MQSFHRMSARIIQGTPAPKAESDSGEVSQWERRGWYRDSISSWLKALTAAELLCVVDTPIFTGNSSSRAEAVLVFQPAMTAPTGVIWAQVPGLEYLTKIHRR